VTYAVRKCQVFPGRTVLGTGITRETYSFRSIPRLAFFADNLHGVWVRRKTPFLQRALFLIQGHDSSTEKSAKEKGDQMKAKISVLMLFLLGAMVCQADQTKAEVVERLQSSAASLREIAAAPDKGIPDEVFKGAKCIAVVPSMIKGGFILGGKHGRGVSTCRLPNGGWSAPAFFTVSGGSWGAQIGVEDVQLVIMVMNDEGMRHLLRDKFQVGGEASAAAGPVGRHASAGVDWKIETSMLTYSRAHGLFAGLDLEGSWIERDKDSNLALYGNDYTSTRLLTGRIVAPAEARPFLAEVRRVRAVSEAKGN
jgi:SH3 domain-containing YSC84-like protein 1